MKRLTVHHGNITEQHVDAIVNAANEFLLGGGGVDGAIHEAAGPALLEACRAIPELSPGVRCPTGEARITPAFGLPARYVIHAVGPVWRGGRAGEDELLASSYRAAFALAETHELSSIAFPTISCGAYQFPLRRAGLIAVRELSKSLAGAKSVASVVLVAFEPETLEMLEELVPSPA